MANSMCKEQIEYIENIKKDMLESTNMTKEEAHDFAFRCWQCGYAKEQEIRNKAIDEFMEHFEEICDKEYHDRCNDFSCCSNCLIAGMREIAEQMKGNDNG